MKATPDMTKQERRQLMGPDRHYLHMAAICTGRTTRMMEEAIRQAKEGRAVYVLCATMDHAKTLEREWADRIDGLGIKIETPTSVGGWDWENMTPTHRVHQNCLFLVDTWVIEKHFSRMLNMLHRWDPDQTPAEKELADKLHLAETYIPEESWETYLNAWSTISEEKDK